ncbi:MAG TPA: ATP-binding cassette domain-containing protein [Terriglobales bacterium]|nr:ATP-binding cassette domain-containing protein [Terriglobales bacterium]
MTDSPQPTVQLRNVSYRLPSGHEILRDLNLDAQCGEVLVLLGRSGSGKTTALKLVNRLREHSSGDISVDGRSTRDWNVIQLRRHIGYSIQEVGLFPHFTIERNIGLVPELENWPEDKIRARVDELVKLVGLSSDIGLRYPHQLSGGQRQRVGVARALAADPPILLMDEPFGALDPLTRADLQREFLSLQQKLKKTVLFVTHDLHEALLLGTRIALLDSGRLVSCSSPQEFLSSQEPLVKQYVEAFGAGDVLNRGRA